MGAQLASFCACCVSKDGKLGKLFRAGAKFALAGLSKLGTVFSKSFGSSSKNTKPNPNQVETYDHNDTGVYKPHAYNIIPKAIDQEFDKTHGKQTYSVDYAPEVDPFKKEKKNLQPISFSLNQGGGSDEAYRKRAKQRRQRKRQRYNDQTAINTPVYNPWTNNRPANHPRQNPYQKRSVNQPMGYQNNRPMHNNGGGGGGRKIHPVGEQGSQPPARNRPSNNQKPKPRPKPKTQPTEQRRGVKPRQQPKHIEDKYGGPQQPSVYNPMAMPSKPAEPISMPDPTINSQNNNKIETIGVESPDFTLDKDEDYGVPLQPIVVGNPKFVFPNEDDHPLLTYSNHQTVVSDSKWVNYHRSIKGEFYDSKFAASERSSLYGLERSEDADDRSKLQKFSEIKWKRLSYLYPEVKVIKNGIQNSDIFQGGLGDCYLLSSIASVAEHPDRIERLLQQRKRSPKGAYCVSLCITGQFVEVYLDDLVPTKFSNPQLAFCNSDEGEIWAILIEKAYAKAYGGYWNIGAGGVSSHALFDLTGGPTETLRTKEPEVQKTLFDKILKADQHGYIMNGGSKGSGEVRGSSGIIAGHAYTIIGAYKLQNGHRVLKLRNPWGSGEWSGEYSDKSSLWTAALKNQLGWSDKNDGTFYMRVEDYMREFSTVSICHYRNDFVLSSFPDVNSSNTFASYQFTLEKSGEYYFGLSQPDKNFFKAGHTYGMLSIVIARIDGKKATYVGGKGYPERDSWFMAKCQPGKYIAFVSTFWDNSNTEDCTIWVYGPKPVPIQRIEGTKNLKKCQEYFRLAIINYAENHRKWKPFSSSDPWNNLKNTSGIMDDGYVIYAAQNLSDYKIIISVDFGKSKNCRLIYPTESAGTMKAKLTMGDKKVQIVLLQVVDYPVSYSMKQGLSVTR